MSNLIYLPSIPIKLQTSITFSASNTTASVVNFTLTGSVYVLELYGVITTALSSNITAAHWRMNDQTNTPAVTLATGTTLSSAAAGGVISKIAAADVALTLSSSAQVRVVEPAVDNENVYSPFILVAKAGVVNTLDFRYTTTNTPATGVIQVFCKYAPMSADGALI